MRNLFLALVVMLAGAQGLPSTAHAASPQDTHAGLRADYSTIHQHTLDNGLTVVVIEDHSVPIVTIEMAVRNGAFTEEEETNGLSHLYEHMFFKANAVYENQEAYMARQRQLGMAWNGTTGSERVNYFFTLPAELLDEGLEFMAAALLTPRFDAEELTREKEVVLGEYDRSEANPFWYLWRGTGNLLWHAYPARKDPLGSREAISNATVEQMLVMKETYYVPNNSLLVLSGDITSDEGLALAQRHFGEWERSADPFEANPVPEHPPLTKDVALSIGKPVGVSVVQMSWHGPNTRDSVEDTYAADVFSYALDQATSQLQKNLVESGVALSASLSYHTQRYTGPISFTGVTAQGNEEALIAAMNEELLRFVDEDYVPAELLETAKTTLSVQDLMGQQSSLDLAHTVSFWWCSAEIDYYLNYIQNLNDVTRQDIQRFVKRWIVNQPRATVLLSSPEVADQWSSERLLEAVQSEVK